MVYYRGQSIFKIHDQIVVQFNHYINETQRKHYKELSMKTIWRESILNRYEQGIRNF